MVIKVSKLWHKSDFFTNALNTQHVICVIWACVGVCEKITVCWTSALSDTKCVNSEDVWKQIACLCLCYFQTELKLHCLPWTLRWLLPPPLPLLLCPCPETHMSTQHIYEQWVNTNSNPPAQTHTTGTLYSGDVWEWSVCRLSCKTVTPFYSPNINTLCLESEMEGWMDGGRGETTGLGGQIETKENENMSVTCCLNRTIWVYKQSYFESIVLQFPHIPFFSESYILCGTFLLPFHHFHNFKSTCFI